MLLKRSHSLINTTIAISDSYVQEICETRKYVYFLKRSVNTRILLFTQGIRVFPENSSKYNVGEVSWIFDIGYWIFNTRKSPVPHERSLSVMRYGLTNDTVF